MPQLENQIDVVTGAGRGFSSGFDVKEPPDVGGGLSRQGLAPPLQMPLVFASMDKPVIGCINGAAIGWGLELALLCDIRLAAENARLADPHVNYGVIDDNGGLYHLPRLVGWSKACELVFTGQPIDGKEAERIGLVNKAVPLEQLAAVTRGMAEMMAKQSPMALQATKRAMRNGLNSDLKTSQDYVIVLLGQLAGSSGLAAMMTANKEKDVK